MQFYSEALFSFSILPAALIGALRMPRMRHSYRPFIFLLWMGLAHEMVVIWMSYQGFGHGLVTNMYLLIKAMMLLWQFWFWSDRTSRWTYSWAAALLVLIWVAESMIRADLFVINSYFVIASSLLIIFLALNRLAQMVVTQSRQLLRHPDFLICLGIALFFSFAALVEIFLVYDLNTSREFQVKIYDLLTYTNLIVNLIYAFAVLWIPQKLRYIVQYL
jgi:hypothetical protein